EGGNCGRGGGIASIRAYVTPNSEAKAGPQHDAEYPAQHNRPTSLPPAGHRELRGKGAGEETAYRDT
ncbi:MAG: hypothetical protein RDU59_11715, partial [Thermodesulfobacteriota bacterium]|nr:hypothetical protein [Thermodesulfobacteriota bacterium]